MEFNSTRPLTKEMLEENFDKLFNTVPVRADMSFSDFLQYLKEEKERRDRGDVKEPKDSTSPKP